MPTESTTPPLNEKYVSHIPALWELINLGYQYLTPEQVLAERGGYFSNVLLESILREQLKKINRIRFKGGEHLFSEENIQSAIQKIKNVHYDGLQKTNAAIYDLITLGTSLEQTIDGDSKSFTLNYIDWENQPFPTEHEPEKLSSFQRQMSLKGVVLGLSGDDDRETAFQTLTLRGRDSCFFGRLAPA